MAIGTRTPASDAVTRLREGAALILATTQAVGRNLINRRAARRMADLPDYLLSDMGLKRDDVWDALAQDWRNDPTYLLAVRASQRSRPER